MTDEELENLADKINCEGGLLYYFNGYTTPESVKGTELYEPVKRLVEAAEEIESIFGMGRL